MAIQNLSGTGLHLGWHSELKRTGAADAHAESQEHRKDTEGAFESSERRERREKKEAREKREGFFIKMLGLN